MSVTLLAFGVCLTLGYAVQTATGFGAMVVATTLGAFFFPLEQIAPTVMPISLAQTSLVLWRDHAHVERRLLLGEVLPWMGLGIPFGVWCAGWMPVTALRGVLGAVIALLVARDLLGVAPPVRPSRLGLIGAGVTEGMLGTGGPLLVWSIGKLQLEPRTIRTTLTAVWLVTEVVVMALWAGQGRLDADTLRSSLLLLPAAPLGWLLGERALRRLDPSRFRRALTVALAVSALALLLR